MLVSFFSSNMALYIGKNSVEKLCNVLEMELKTYIPVGLKFLFFRFFWWKDLTIPLMHSKREFFSIICFTKIVIKKTHRVLEYDKEVRLSCAVRGFHYYRSICNPSSNESLKCYHVGNNPFARFSIKVVHFTSE